MVKSLLEKFNLKFEDLTPDELATLDQWAAKLQGAEITVKDVERFVEALIGTVSRELASTETPASFAALLFRGKRERFLKARLHNLLALRDFLSGPEKARAFVDRQLSQLASAKGH